MAMISSSCEKEGKKMVFAQRWRSDAATLQRRRIKKHGDGNTTLIQQTETDDEDNSHDSEFDSIFISLFVSSSTLICIILLLSPTNIDDGIGDIFKNNNPAFRKTDSTEVLLIMMIHGCWLMVSIGSIFYLSMKSLFPPLSFFIILLFFLHPPMYI